MRVSCKSVLTEIIIRGVGVMLKRFNRDSSGVWVMCEGMAGPGETSVRGTADVRVVRTNPTVSPPGDSQHQLHENPMDLPSMYLHSTH